jgi:hypothetical protein
MTLAPGGMVPANFSCDSVTYNQNNVQNKGKSGTYGLNRATNPHHMIVTRQPLPTAVPSAKAGMENLQYLSGKVVINDAFGHQCEEISGTVELSFTAGQAQYNHVHIW